jgi:hypothetical protein
MKKLIVTVLSGIMLMGFVSCGEKGSKEFNETKAILEKYDKAIDNAKTCEEVKEAHEAYYKEVEEFRKTPKYPGKNQLNYDGKDRMTDEEVDNYSKFWVQVDKKYLEKKKELCK